MPIDPVCKMDVEVDEAFDSEEYNGKTWYFCSSDCKDAFDNDPARYSKERKTA